MSLAQQNARSAAPAAAPEQQAPVRQAATDLSAFGASSASSYQGSLGNQGVAGAAGLEAGAGLEAVAELDPALAVALENVQEHAETTLADFEGLLGAEHADVVGLHALLGFVDATVAELEGADQAEVDALLERLDAYRKKVALGANLVEGEGVIQEALRDAELAPLIAGLGLLSVEVVEATDAASEMASLQEQLAAAQAELTEGLDAIVDVTVREAAKRAVEALAGPLDELAKELGPLATVAGLAVKVASSFAEDTLEEMFRPGGARVDGLDQLVDDASGYAEDLNEAAGLADELGVEEMVEQVGLVKDTLEPVAEADAAAKKALGAVDRMAGLARRMLAGPAPRLSGAPGLMGRAAELALEVAEIGLDTRETVSVFEQQLAEQRAQDPEVYAPLA